MLDEATARATAIHDGAERRLNLLVARHTETLRRLTEVRDVVTNLVAGEAARGSLEDEVARSVASAISGSGSGSNAVGAPAPAPASRPAGTPEGRHAPGASTAPPSPQAGRAGARTATLADNPERQKTTAGLDSTNGVTESPAAPARATHRAGPAAPAERTAETGRPVKSDSPVFPRPAASDPADKAD
jgi:hypothetical protein